MEHELNEEQKSMMRSVSKNIIGKFQLTPEPLYTGLHGQIFQITSQKGNQNMILKVIWKANNQSLYKNQKHIHQSLKNRYIVQLEKCFSDQMNNYLVMEYCQRGNFRTIMTGKLAVQTVREYGLQIVKGLHYLHKNKVVHHDIKPENILLTDQNQIKICDFGLSTRFEEGKNVKGCQGTLLYAPPEAIQLHNEKYDIWSLGCLLYQMATGKLPFSFKSWKQHALTLNQSYVHNFAFDSSLPSSLLHLLRKMLTFDKRQRVGIDQVLNHNFFTGIPLVEPKQQERPLVQKKRQAKTMPKSLENKLNKECSKDSKNTHQSRNNKQNTDRCNKILSSKRNEAPNYRQILQKKFKLTDPMIQVSKTNSGGKIIKNKTVSEDLKISKEKSSTMILTHFSNRNGILQSRKQNCSPLNTFNMRINPLKIKNTLIKIDADGLTREKHSKQHPSQLINISCDGLLVRMKKGKKEKIFSFDSLPEEYIKEYQECKRILKEIQSQEPKMTYKNRSFLSNKQLSIQMMYNNNLHIAVEGQFQLKDVPVEQFLSNMMNIREDLHREIRNIYFRLVEMSRS